MTPERWHRIEQLYHQARECATDQRADWLTEACGGDDRLRRKVESLLDANDQAGEFIAVPALEADEQTRLLVHQHLNHYRILSRIGVGGMGEVWLALDTKLERRVALKLLPVQFTRDADRLRRFIREAKSASALNHPNIITIYEIGEVGDTHFIATEFIEGVTLRQRMESGRLELHIALNVITQVAAALDTVHK
ncbi:MAG: serine/threonine protein kinase, partial [Acidobacteriota bacterium]|nr:serine/threonine protein kinase [Acidobacteriota bacterium]